MKIYDTLSEEAKNKPFNPLFIELDGSPVTWLEAKPIVFQSSFHRDPKDVEEAIKIHKASFNPLFIELRRLETRLFR